MALLEDFLQKATDAKAEVANQYAAIMGIREPQSQQGEWTNQHVEFISDMHMFNTKH